MAPARWLLLAILLWPCAAGADAGADFDAGKAAFAHGNYADAVRLFSAVIAAAPDQKLLADAYIDRGAARAWLGDTAAALEDYAAAMRADPQNLVAQVNWAITARDKGDTEGAKAALQAAADSPAAAASCHNITAAADARWELGDPQTRDEAYLAAMNEAVAAFPDCDRAYADRGTVHQDREEWQQAADDFAAALAIEPGDPDSWNGAAWAYCMMKDYQRCLDEAQRGLAIRPNDSNSIDTRGVAYRGLGDTARALADFERACTLEPDNEEACGHYHELEAADGPTPQSAEGAPPRAFV